MQSQQLVLSLVLNFLYHVGAVENVHADIAKTGVEFSSNDLQFAMNPQMIQ